MDIVLGVSMAPTMVQMVLVEGENADGVTVDQDTFDVNGAQNVGAAAPDRVVAAILGTREGAVEGGYELTSTGVTFSDQLEAAVLRDALAQHKVENVMLVSAFLAAAALAQAVGGAVGYARTALLLVEADTATLAIVDGADGAIIDVRRENLSDSDDEAVAQLTQLVSGLDRRDADRPDGVLLVGGAGVQIAPIKPPLEAATTLPVSAPEEPETALARGAALASAHAPLFASSTRAMAWAQDPGTGAVDPDVLRGFAYAYVAPAAVDYNATSDNAALAYSAVPDEPDVSYSDIAVAPDEVERLDSALLDFRTAAVEQQHRPFLLAGSVAALFLVGVVALAVSLAVSMRPTANERPNAGGHVVVPTKQAAPPPPPTAQVPPPPAPAPANAPKQAPAPQPAAPAHVAPAPAPAHVPAPAPAAPPPPPPPLPLPIIQIPGLPGIGGPPGNKGHSDDDDRGGWKPGKGWKPGRGGDHDDDHGGGWQPEIPFFGGGGHGHGGGHGGFNIPGIPGL